MKSCIKFLINLYFKYRYPKLNIKVTTENSYYFLKNINKNLKHIILGNSKFGKDVKINDGVKFLGKVVCDGKIEIGRYTSINGPGTFVLARENKIKIGSFCSIAPGVRIQEYNHDYTRVTTYYIERHLFGKEEIVLSNGNIIIEEDVWIGGNSVILSGITIGRGSIVGAGSVVTKDVKPYSIVGGNPAKIIRMRFSQEKIETLEKSQWWTWSEEKIKKNEKFFM